MTYPFTCNITDDHLGLVVIYDFECEVEVEVILSGGALDITAIDVLIDGKSMRNGDECTRALFGKVANLADAEIDAGGNLWSAIQEAEGIIQRGRGPLDPDAHFVRVA